MTPILHRAVTGILAATLAVSAPAIFADDDPAQKSFSIEAQPLAAALSEFARQADLQILFRPDAVSGLKCERIVGTYPVLTTLERLLQGTGLYYEVIDERTVAVSQGPKPSTARFNRTSMRLAQASSPRATPAGSGATNEPPAIEEVIVTAQRREERLQDVPLSISAIGGEQLELFGAVNSLALNAMAPNVTVRQGTAGIGNAIIAIRGSSTGYAPLWMDPAIAIYLNGVYLGKSASNTIDMSNVERVEVLRGPQGTLFGRNTEGGAINFITRKPTGVFDGSVTAELGNFDRRSAHFRVDFPKFGIASLSLAARKEQSDGWARNLTGPDLGAIDNDFVNLSANLDFTDSFTAAYDFVYSNAERTPNVQSIYALDGWTGAFPSVFGPLIGGAIEDAFSPYVVTSRPDRTSTNGPNIADQKDAFHALTLSYQIADRDSLKYIAAYRKFDLIAALDIDGTPLESITPAPGLTWGLNTDYENHQDYKQHSHELQWTGERDRFNYVFGLYYFRDDGEHGSRQNFALFGAAPQRADFGAETRAVAAFGQVDYRLSDHWTATIGARYTEEKKSGWTHRYRTNGFGGPFVADIFPRVSYSTDFSDTSPMAALSYKPNADLNFYARVAKGFKSGGFSSELTDPRVSDPFKPQKVISTEVGLKSMLLGGRALANLALFQNKLTDQQLNQLLPGTTQSWIENAGKSTYRGAELEVTFKISNDWQMQLAYGYLDAKFDKYIDNALNIPGQPLIETASNRVAPYAPESTLSVRLDGTLLHTGWADLRARADFAYTSKTYINAANKDLSAPNAGGQYAADIDVLPSNKNLDAGLMLQGIRAGGGTVDVSLLGRNLTDEDDVVQFIDFGMFRNVTWTPPRTYMVTATYRW